MATDYYEVLGVSAEADAEQIRVAFRALAREHHPDATGGNVESEQRYKEISEAYAVLSDPSRRQQYDNARMGFGSFSATGFGSAIEDIFETFFGGGATRTRARTRARQGESLEMELEVTLEEAVFGADRTLSFQRYEPCATCSGQGTSPGSQAEKCGACDATGQVQQARRTILGTVMTAHPCAACRATGWIVPDPCKDCRGTGRIEEGVDLPLQVPGGIDNGDRLRLDGEGEAGFAGGVRGDLYVRFRLGPDERFERVGDDLVAWVDVPMTTAALGGSVMVQTMDGESELDIRAGTQSNETLRFKGHGVPRRNGRGRGDLIVRVLVTTPTKLGRKQKDLMNTLRSELKEDGERSVQPRRILDR